MRSRPSLLYYSPPDRPVPELVVSWASHLPLPLIRVHDRPSIENMALRTPPALIVIDADGARDDAQGICSLLKSDPYTAIIPVAVLSGGHSADEVRTWFEVGADEVLTPIFSPEEQRSRLGVLLSRTERNVAVHPSTRLPGTTEIERAIRVRLDSADPFAVCYVDLDHFKEFNDRYSYYDGDRVIFLVSRILRDVVKGMCGSEGFVGHIGGDDFITILAIDKVQEVCSEIISVFDALIPFQYNEQDRRAGYFFGKDRRGHLHRVPLMTLSIGIVTNQRREFTHPAEVSELATEMKSYAKTLPGSVFVVDRRTDSQ